MACSCNCTIYVMMFPTNYQCGAPYTYGTVRLYNPNTVCTVTVNVTTPLLSAAGGGIGISATFQLTPGTDRHVTVPLGLMLTGAVSDESKGYFRLRSDVEM